MTEEQFTISVRAFARRRPFRPFLVEFVTGQSLRVEHPEGIAPFLGVWVYHARAGNRMVFASSSVCRLLDHPLAESD